MQIYILSNREVIKNEVAGNNGENNAEIMYFHFPEQIVGIDLSNVTKWIQFKNENLDLLQMIENDEYSLTDLITQYESVEYQVLLKYNNLVLWKSNIDELDFGESLDIDVTITIDELSVLNQLRLQVIELKKQYEDAINQGNTDIANLIKQVENLETKINNAEALRETAETNRVIAEDERVKAETERNQKLADLVKKVENTISRLSHSVDEYNQNAETQLNKLQTTADTSVSAVLNAKNDSIKAIQDEQENVIEAIGNEVNQRVTEIDNHVKSKVTEFDTNAKNKTDTFNQNVLSKTTEFNNNSTSKTSSFNENSTAKLNDFNSNAAEKLEDFNSNYETKLEEINSDLNVQRITDLEEENEYQNKVIEGLLSDKETGTAEGDNITINDASIAPIKFECLYGKEIKQEAREGYNLLDTKKYIASSNDGITPSVNEDGTINVTGISSVNYPRFLNNINLLNMFEDGETLTLWQQEPTNLIYMQIIITSNDNVQSFIGTSTTNLRNVTIDKKNNKSYILMIQGGNANGVEYNISNFKFMLLKGSYTAETIPEYEQFGQSPSKDFPSNLNYVKGNQEVYHTNENLIDLKSKMFKTANYGNIQIDIIDNDIILNGTPTSSYVALSTRIDITDILKDSQTYTMYRENDNLVYNQISAIKYDGSVDYYSLNGSANRRTFIVDKTKYRKYEYYVQTNVLSVMKSLENYVVKCMLLEGDKLPKKFTSYSEKINLTNLPEMPSENDYIYYKEDLKKYFIHNEWNKYNFTGNEVITMPNAHQFNIDNAFKDYYKLINDSNSYSNYFKCISQQTSNTGFMNLVNNNNFDDVFDLNCTEFNYYTVRFYSTSFSTIDEFKTFLQENNIHVIYKLLESTDKEIKDTTLIEQLNKLRRMMSYKGTNHFIVTSDNNIPANLKIEYIKSSKSIILKLEDRIVKLENQINSNTTVQNNEDEFIL